MKRNLFLTNISIIILFIACSTCEEKTDTYSRLNDFDKTVLNYSSDTELKYLKNKSEEIDFKIPKTLN